MIVSDLFKDKKGGHNMYMWYYMYVVQSGTNKARSSVKITGFSWKEGPKRIWPQLEGPR